MEPVNDPSNMATSPALSSLPQPIRIPSILPKNLQIDLLILDKLIRRNKAQHRSALFFQRAEEVYRLGKLVYANLDSLLAALEREQLARKREATVSAAASGRAKRQAAGVDVSRSKDTLSRLVNRLVFAAVRATEHVNKIIHHLHFLPFVTVLLGIYSRIWVLSLDISALISPFPTPALGIDGPSISVSSSTSGPERPSFLDRLTLFGTLDEVTRRRLECANAELRNRAKQLEEGGSGPGSEAKGKGRDKSLLERLACEEMELQPGEEIGMRIDRVLLPEPSATGKDEPAPRDVYEAPAWMDATTPALETAPTASVGPDKKVKSGKRSMAEVELDDLFGPSSETDSQVQELQKKRKRNKADAGLGEGGVEGETSTIVVAQTDAMRAGAGGQAKGHGAGTVSGKKEKRKVKTKKGTGAMDDIFGF